MELLVVFVRVYLEQDQDRLEVASAIESLEGVERVWIKEEAAKDLELPLDREGDLAVVADKRFVIGGRETDHDLSALKETSSNPWQPS